jgi:DNA polymerase III subunit delta'
MSFELLKTAIKNGKIAHAYILAGPKGCGKSLLARDLAKALNCQDTENAPCGSCASCRKIDKDIHPDVLWVRREEDDSEIKIEKIRWLESRIILKPYEGKYKIFIIEDAELMSPEAANSFLKTLEEPPPDSVLVLIAEQTKSLLATIISRCQTVRMNPVRHDEPAQLLDDVLKEFENDECIASYTAANRDELSIKLNVLAGWYRDLLVFRSTGDEGLLTHRDRTGDIRKKAENYGTDELIRMLESIVSAKEKLDSKVNPKLVLAALYSNSEMR